MRVLIKSDWIVKSDGEVLKEGWVVVENGRISGYYRRPPGGNFQVVEHLHGYLYPPFVNSHTHLELSLLSFNPDRFSSFFDWLLWIIGKRGLFTESEMLRALERAEKELLSCGVAYVGDISSFGISPDFPFKRLKVIAFREFIGKEFYPEKFPPPVSAHSVYSVSFEALKSIAYDSIKRGYRFQLHLGETEEEQKFVRCQKNLFEERIYPVIGRKRYERVCTENLVDYLRKAGALISNLIAVHCTNLSEWELDLLTSAGASVVFCPRSNVHLKVGFPNVEHLLGYEKVALATDGLSSNVNLSVVEELKTVYYSLEGRVSVRELLPLITTSAARSLSIEDYEERALFTFLHSGSSVADPYAALLQGKEFKVLDYTSSL